MYGVVVVCLWGLGYMIRSGLEVSLVVVSRCCDVFLMHDVCITIFICLLYLIIKGVII